MKSTSQTWHTKKQYKLNINKMASWYYKQQVLLFKFELEIVFQLSIQGRQENANTFEKRWKIYAEYTGRVI